MIKRQYIKTTEDFKDNMGGYKDLVILIYSDEAVSDKYSVSLSGTTGEIVFESIFDVYEEARDFFILVVNAHPITFENAIALGLTRNT